MKIEIAEIPGTIQEFRSMTEEGFKDPARVCAWLIPALALYVQNPDEGIEALDLLRGEQKMNGYDRQFLKDRFRGKPYPANAYFAGAHPENQYEPAVPYAVELTEDTHPAKAGYRKFFIHTAGADSPRPVTLKQYGNDWALHEYFSILSGMRMPVNQ